MVSAKETQLLAESLFLKVEEARAEKNWQHKIEGKLS